MNSRNYFKYSMFTCHEEEVVGFDGEQLCVDVEHLECGCRRWRRRRQAVKVRKSKLSAEVCAINVPSRNKKKITDISGRLSCRRGTFALSEHDTFVDWIEMKSVRAR